eukprot:7345907-Prymnesium_polylepis.2
MIVLKNPQLADNRFERWTSLVLAPWVARLGRASMLARDLSAWLDRHGLRYGEAVARLIARDYAPESLVRVRRVGGVVVGCERARARCCSRRARARPLTARQRAGVWAGGRCADACAPVGVVQSFPEAYLRVMGVSPPEELMRTLPGLERQEVLLPARDVAGKTAALVQGTSKLATETVVEALDAVYEKKSKLALGDEEAEAGGGVGALPGASALPGERGDA